jgi:hypothetical protein
MYTVKQTFHPPFAPLAEPGAVVSAPKVRFTILTPRLIRIEYSPSESFEDRPSQAFWYRSQPVPAFKSQPQMTLAFRLILASCTLSTICAPGSFQSAVSGGPYPSIDRMYYYGDPGDGNLLGTYRTLDGLDGKADLETGLVSRDGWAVYNDSGSLVFDEDGWLQPRQAEEDALDLYFFGYGHDYLGCIQEFQKVAGQTPLLPRWALGNWWSRYYPVF